MRIQRRIDELISTIESLRDQLDLMNQDRYGSKNPKRKLTKSTTNVAERWSEYRSPHTIISTCKIQGVSALQYFKMF